MSKQAKPDYPINELLARRWSPYGLEPKPMPAAELRSLLEAARWAPSSFNEQPWRYIVAVREDEAAFKDLLSCLVEPNRQWAQSASALLIGVASLEHERNGKPNATAIHDLGLASAQLTAEATARGLAVHQMSGILPDVAREQYGIPAGFQAVTAVAIGFRAPLETLPGPLAERDGAPRERRPQGEFVFAGQWGKAAAFD